MSSTEEDRPDRASFARLDRTVTRLAARISELEDRVRDARERNRKMQDLLERFRSGEEDPAELAGALDRVRAENEELRVRLETGRKSVERLLSRIRFLEDQR